MNYTTLGAVGLGYKSQPRCCPITVLGKLFTPIVPLFTKQRNWYRPTGREGNCGPGGKYWQPTAGFMTHVTCPLTANQFRNPTLSNGVWSTFTFTFIQHTHTHPFNGPFPGLLRYQKDKTNLDFTEARDSEWQWHQLGHMQVCT